MDHMIDEDDFNEADMFAAPAPKKLPPLQQLHAPAGNPLKKYFRLPGLNITLPSNGRFSSIDFQSDGTVEVFPMRAADELLINTPDALMSGSALENLIASCVPAVRDPKNLPIPDMDVLLLAIRAASSGDMMTVDVECEKCETKSEVDVHLGTILATAQPVPEETQIRLTDDLTVTLRPHTLATQTKVLNAAFFEQRKAQQVTLSEDMTDEEKQHEMNNIYKRMTELEVEVTSGAVLAIATPDGVVTNPTYIREFLSETNKEWVRKIRDKVDQLNTSMDKSFEVVCPKCDHHWKTELSFDPSTFFAPSS